MSAIRYFFMYLGFATFACTVLLLGVGCIGELRYWLAHRHEERDQFGNYLEGLRTPGMGDLRLDPDAPLYSDLADEQPSVVETLDAARLRRSGT